MQKATQQEVAEQQAGNYFVCFHMAVRQAAWHPYVNCLEVLRFVVTCWKPVSLHKEIMVASPLNRPTERSFCHTTVAFRTTVASWIWKHSFFISTFLICVAGTSAFTWLSHHCCAVMWKHPSRQLDWHLTIHYHFWLVLRTSVMDKLIFTSDMDGPWRVVFDWLNCKGTKLTEHYCSAVWAAVFDISQLVPQKGNCYLNKN